ncbi:methyltransferase domain-containing protein [Sedimentitalea sp. HM32M-2]|uniref:methyltransferase domain-containing protein n=1 Tax=Sedimentitalea sp. HM32M-2 TaxID=3351566 RepID=UPI0036D285EE
MLSFDDKTAKLLDDAYQGADVTRRRRASFDALNPLTGERVLDLGCGNGLLTLELARAVGPKGQICGLDSSPDMLASAQDRCADRPNVDLQQGSADDLPYPDRSLDKAVSIQVFEYFTDMRPALKELKRVLRPGGRLVIADMHWDTWAWFSDQPERMRNMQDIWDRHLAERCVPALLPDLLTQSGFRPLRMIPVPVCDITLRPDGLAAMMMQFMTRYAISTGAMSKAEARAWADEQHDLARAGRFFFALTHFVCVAERP